MSEEGLCFECWKNLTEQEKVIYGGFYDKRSNRTVWWHCHHDPHDRIEKPKCWCEGKPLGHYEMFSPELIRIIFNFCPQCGRKL